MNEQTPGQGGRSVGRHMAVGAAWMVMMRFAVRGIGVINTMILARLLVPADFGLIAIAAVILGLLDVLGSIGIDVILIRDPDASRDKYNTGWTLQILRGCTLATVMALSAGAAAAWLNEPRLEAVLYWLAIAVIIGSFQNVGVVNFRKNFHFHRDFQFMLMPKIAGLLVAVPLAFWWRNYWALVAGMVAPEVIKVIASYVMEPYRPRPCLREWRDIFGFSQWLVANNVLRYISTRSDTFFIARLAETHVVGAYAIAYEISNLALTELVSPIQRALLPGYSRIAHDRPAIQDAYIDVLALVLTCALPLALGTALTADLVIKIFLGDKWNASIPFLQLLAICGAIRLGNANAGVVYQALGKPAIIAMNQGFQTMLVLPLLYLGITRYGPIGAPYALLISASSFLALNIFMVLRLLALPFSVLLLNIWRPLLSAGALALTVGVIRDVSPTNSGNTFMALLELVLVALSGVAGYTMTMLALWHISGRPRGTERIILMACKALYGRFRT